MTEIELRNYLESAIRQELTTCTLTKVGDAVYELQLPLSQPRILQNFLTMYQPWGEESSTLFKQFKHEIEDKHVLRMTFNQQVAYDNRKLLFMNIYNPIILACQNYFHKHNDDSKTSFCYALTQDDLLQVGSAYYQIVYQMSVTRKVLGVPKHTETLLPLLYSVNDREIVKNEDLINRVFSRSQTDGKEHNAENADIDTEMLQDMRYDFAEEINEIKTEMLSEIKLQVESDILRNVKQTNEYYASFIDNQRRYIRNWESDIEMLYNVDEKRVQQLQGVIRLAKSRILQMEKEKEDRLTQIREASHIEISESIVSLNLINII